MKNVFVGVGILCIALVCIGVLMQSCSTSQEKEGRMDLMAVQTALLELVSQNKDEIIKDASFIYEEDSFAGAKKTLGENKWVLGSWVLTGTQASMQAKVQKRFGQPGDEWEAEVLDVDLKLKSGKYVIESWRAYKTFGE